jgi:hypothetical protein
MKDYHVVLPLVPEDALRLPAGGRVVSTGLPLAVQLLGDHCRLVAKEVPREVLERTQGFGVNGVFPTGIVGRPVQGEWATLFSASTVCHWRMLTRMPWSCDLRLCRARPDDSSTSTTDMPAVATSARLAASQNTAKQPTRLTRAG